MRFPHYWKKAGPAAAPSNIIVVDVETWFGERAAVKGGELHTLRLGCAIAYRLERGERTRVQRLEFTDSADFWRLVESRLDERRPLWVFAHNANYDLGILNAWLIICGEEFVTNKAAMSNTMVWITGHWKEKPITFCDTMNYYHSSLKSMGKSVGLEKMAIDFDKCDRDELNRYCWNDVDITALALDKLIAFVREQELGPWQPSIAGLAFSAYRSRFMRPRSVLVHSYVDVLAMERDAYVGGIVATNFVGRVEGPVYEVDVCSMFPHVARNYLPEKILGQSRRMSGKLLLEMSKEFMLCANVVIKSDTNTYPVHLPHGTYYPVGEYTTSLAHPELVLALQRGDIRWVNFASWYTRSKFFKSYMEHFIAMKSQYRQLDPPNECFATLCKYYGNSLYGKCGQQSPQWREWCDSNLAVIEEQRKLPKGSLQGQKPPEVFMAEESMSFADLGCTLAVRNYWGALEVKCEHTESRDSCPIVAATITSYARVFLRKCQDIAGPKNWYYSDTDSLWCNGEGLRNLTRAGLIASEVIGKLSVVREHRHMIVHGNKDYETDTVRKLKGIRMSARPCGPNVYEQEQFPSATSQLRRGKHDGLYIRRIRKHLARQINRCKVGPDGWTSPLRFPDDFPGV